MKSDKAQQGRKGAPRPQGQGQQRQEGGQQRGQDQRRSPNPREEEEQGIKGASPSSELEGNPDEEIESTTGSQRDLADEGDED